MKHIRGWGATRLWCNPLLALTVPIISSLMIKNNDKSNLLPSLALTLCPLILVQLINMGLLLGPIRILGSTKIHPSILLPGTIHKGLILTRIGHLCFVNTARRLGTWLISAISFMDAHKVLSSTKERKLLPMPLLVLSLLLLRPVQLILLGISLRIFSLFQVLIFKGLWFQVWADNSMINWWLYCNRLTWEILPMLSLLISCVLLIFMVLY